MYSDRKKKKTLWIALAILLLALLLFAPPAVRRSDRAVNEESATAIREAIRYSALQCYAVEGVYPPDLAYLEDNYGLHINTRDYYVSYEAFASNLPPTVRVIRKG